jgi:hypothetical protein
MAWRMESSILTEIRQLTVRDLLVCVYWRSSGLLLRLSHGRWVCLGSTLEPAVVYAERKTR